MDMQTELENLRRKLTETTLTYREIATRAGISTKTVGRLAGGSETNPRIMTMQAVGRAITQGELAHGKNTD